MALYATWTNPNNPDQIDKFSIGDTLRVHQLLVEGDRKNQKERTQIFEGMVIAIKGKGNNKSITVRKIGANLIGVERIWPLMSPVIKLIERKSSGHVKRAKLFYTRDKSRKELRKITQRGK
jgi:large subunit ribosomal protein L19